MESQLKPQRIRPWPALLAGLLLGAALGLIVFFGIPSRAVETSVAENSLTTSEQLQTATGLEIGSPAPQFQLQSTEGEAIDLESLRGNLVLLNFWATWCAPCRTEMPLLEQTYQEHRADGLIVLGIDFDEPIELVQSFGDEFGLTFPLLLDPGGQVQQLYRVRGYPTSVLLDREGKVAYYKIGILSEQELGEALEQAGVGS